MDCVDAFLYNANSLAKYVANIFSNAISTIFQVCM